jgi:hypothetical protein
MTNASKVSGLLLFLLLIGCAGRQPALPTVQQVIEAKEDLWGEAALRQPGGPTYDFFAKLLPPLRYVDAEFRIYPIVLSAPSSPAKGRLVSNGSGINLRARQPNWNNESGTPVHILVGRHRDPFGEDPTRLDGPHYVDGYLPIVQLRYQQEGEEYREEAFASVDPEFASRGAVVVKFEMPAENRGRMELRFEGGYDLFKVDAQHVVRDGSGTVLAQLDDNWDFAPARCSFTSKPQHAKTLVAMIFASGGGATTHSAGPGMQPEMEAAGRAWATTGHSPVGVEFYERQREMCVRRWNDLLAGGMNVTVPEPVVNNAWRTLVIAQHAIRAGEQMNYSALNQYARQYSNESGDSIRSLTLWGHADVARRSLRPLFIYRRRGIELHDAGFKLQDLTNYYLETRDAQTVRDLRALWQREIDLILSSRQPDGLLPKEAYCSDIRTPVRSLNTNANCWRGLRDMSIVLEEIGEHEQAAKLASICAEYQKIILSAMEKAIVRTVDPPFVRVALGGEEPISNPITSTRYGSYWNLVVPCVLWSGIFPINSEPADEIIHYIQRNGGLCMGLTRVQSVRGVWVNVHNIDDLYVIRYSNALLKRDEPDRALVTFYGKLAQGFTAETFTDGESTGIEPLDKFGRQVALPPNSTANASFLIQLRNLLVQDWDMDDDGKPETLRLLFATPREWLEDAKQIKVEHAPTAFGELSLTATSHLKAGYVNVDVTLPPRSPRKTLLRLRLPKGYHVKSARVDGAQMLSAAADDSLDLTALHGHVRLIVKTGK